VFSAGFGHVRGIGGDSVDDSQTPRFSDFFYICTINKYLHSNFYFADVFIGWIRSLRDLPNGMAKVEQKWLAKSD